MCKTESGCPIEAEAKDPGIQRLISGFMRYKELNRSGAPESLQTDSLRQCGALSLCPDFLLAMNPILNESMRIKQDEAERVDKWRREDKARVAASKAKAKGRR